MTAARRAAVAAAAVDAFLADVAAAAGPAAATKDPGLLAGYETSVLGHRGRAAAVVRPASTAEVSAFLAAAHRHGVALVPQGANTGLVNAGTPDFSRRQVVLSLDRLAGGIEVDPVNRSVTADAGTRLSALNRRLEADDLVFPVGLSADPSVGGMVATNTGGWSLIRHGDIRANLLGLEVVLPDAEGTVLSDLSGVRKNNAGLDLKQVFVGSGGALGVITRAVLQVRPRPVDRAAAIMVPDGDAAVPALLDRFERRFEGALTAFEGLSRAALDSAFGHRPDLARPFGWVETPSYAVLVELITADPERALAPALEAAIARAAADGLLLDAAVGAPERLWAVREAIGPSLTARGKVIAFDLGFARSQVMPFRRHMTALLAAEFPEAEVCDFGHVGDGGLHFNIVNPAAAAETATLNRTEALRRLVYGETVERFGGSFSAEHGVGPYNLAHYRRQVPDLRRRYAAEVQRAFNSEALLGRISLE